MNIAEIMAALPEEWVEQEICRTPKRLSNREKRAMLDPYQIGLMRLAEMSIGRDNFTDEQIILLGNCSIYRIKVVVGRVSNHWWVITNERPQHFKAYYVVMGKRVTTLHHHKQGTIAQLMDDFESRDNTKPLEFMKADEIFSICKGTRFRKKPGGLSRKEFCGKREESVIIEQRNKPKRGERVHMRALMRKSKTIITWSSTL